MLSMHSPFPVILVSDWFRYASAAIINATQQFRYQGVQNARISVSGMPARFLTADFGVKTNADLTPISQLTTPQIHTQKHYKPKLETDSNICIQLSDGYSRFTISLTWTMWWEIWKRLRDRQSEGRAGTIKCLTALSNVFVVVFTVESDISFLLFFTCLKWKLKLLFFQKYFQL